MKDIRIPHPWEVIRALPRIGFHLLLPAMVVGAFGGGVLDVLFASDGYPLAKVGTLLGPLVFAAALNGLERAEARCRTEVSDETDAYRRKETDRRLAAARGRGELVRFEDKRRATKR